MKGERTSVGTSARPIHSFPIGLTASGSVPSFAHIGVQSESQTLSTRHPYSEWRYGSPGEAISGSFNLYCSKSQATSFSVRTFGAVLHILHSRYDSSIAISSWSLS